MGEGWEGFKWVKSVTPNNEIESAWKWWPQVIGVATGVFGAIGGIIWYWDHLGNGFKIALCLVGIGVFSVVNVVFKVSANVRKKFKELEDENVGLKEQLRPTGVPTIVFDGVRETHSLPNTIERIHRLAVDNPGTSKKLTGAKLEVLRGNTGLMDLPAVLHQTHDKQDQDAKTDFDMTRDDYKRFDFLIEHAPKPEDKHGIDTVVIWRATGVVPLAIDTEYEFKLKLTAVELDDPITAKFKLARDSKGFVEISIVDTPLTTQENGGK